MSSDSTSARSCSRPQSINRISAANNHSKVILLPRTIGFFRNSLKFQQVWSVVIPFKSNETDSACTEYPLPVSTHRLMGFVLAVCCGAVCSSSIHYEQSYPILPTQQVLLSCALILTSALAHIYHPQHLGAAWVIQDLVSDRSLLSNFHNILSLARNQRGLAYTQNTSLHA